MRFEAKHQYFKRVASKLNNFKNVSLSLANGHQLKQFWELTSLDTLKQETKSSGGTSTLFNSLSTNVQSLLLNFCDVCLEDISFEEKVWRVTNLVVDHVKYSVGNVYVLDIVHEENVPIFFRITHCIKFRSRWLLCGRIYFSSSFSTHYHGYIVSDCGDTIVISPGQELDHQALDIYHTADGDQLVMLDYLPCNSRW